MGEPRFVTWRRRLRRSELTIGAIETGCLIRDAMDVIFDGYLTPEYLSEQCLATPSMMEKYINELELEGWLVVDGDLHKNPQYLLVVPEVVE